MGTSQTGAIVADRLFDGTVLRGPTALLHRDGAIVGLVSPVEVPPDCARVELPPGALLAPGFIDVQVNGGGGVLLNDDPSPSAMAAIIAAHRRYGTTACLPTLISDQREITAAAVAAARAMTGAPGFLGLHLEGPFLSPARKGVHRADRLTAPDDADVAMCSGAALVTLAPECVPPGFIRALVARGVRVAAGHSDATAAQMWAAADEGLSGITHLFNAMAPLQGRVPGVAGAALADERLFAGIICDGLHVDPIMVRAAWHAKGAARLMLVTDAMPSVGASGDRFMLQGSEIRLIDGRLVAPDGTIAGAHLDMASAVRNAVRLAGIPLADALTMATSTPARFLGIADRLGHLAPGMAADAVALDGDQKVVATWRGGSAQ